MLKNSSPSFSPGTHLLADFYDAVNLSDQVLIESALREAAELCGAQVLKCDMHSFGHGMGLTGVLLLAESHISIHTWPEKSFAAVDIFMCGSCQPKLAIAPIQKALRAKSVDVKEYSRGAKLDYATSCPVL